MRACATMNVLVVLGVAFAATFTACASGSPEASSPGTTSDGSGKTEEQPGSAAKPGENGAASTATPGAPVADKGPKKEPQTTADCKELLSEITNDPPDGGVVMNNAQPAADAGASDRFQPMVELMKAKRDGFRCCFDLWARNNPGASGKVAFVLDLAPDGTLKSAKVKHEESDIHAPEVESCMVELAKSLSYPKSPSGKVTTYTHRFEFKARH